MFVWLMAASFILPTLSGILLPVIKPDGWARRVYVTAVCALTCALVALAASGTETGTLPLNVITLSDGLTVSYSVDGVSTLFAILFSGAFFLVSIYAPTYIAHEGHDDRFFAFFLISLGALLSLSFSANVLTLYFSFELVTLASTPLVLHSGTKEAVAAALKYLFYSVAGALLGLFGIIFIHSYTNAGAFASGGTLQNAGDLLPLAVFLCIVGFGTKAGMYPMHGWLPSAHPTAPAPASALLSGIIAKAGVLAVLRVVFYAVGADAIRGTWVQYAWMALAALTVVMGSMMAYHEKLLKKRLAFSTVSNISYIMLGLSTLTATGETGALLHLFAHALAKDALFLAAGSIIFMTSKTTVDELDGLGDGLGRSMPVTLGAFTVASLSLVGIPPLLGFTSKWYLASSGIELGGVPSIIIPAVLIISALLTAGYLLPIVINGYFPGALKNDGRGKSARKADAENGVSRCEAPVSMVIPTVAFAALSLLIGIFGGALSSYIASVL